MLMKNWMTNESCICVDEVAGEMRERSRRHLIVSRWKTIHFLCFCHPCSVLLFMFPLYLQTQLWGNCAGQGGMS